MCQNDTRERVKARNKQTKTKQKTQAAEREESVNDADN